jgi:hypothetical protein
MIGESSYLIKEYLITLLGLNRIYQSPSTIAEPSLLASQLSVALGQFDDGRFRL